MSQENISVHAYIKLGINKHRTSRMVWETVSVVRRDKQIPNTHWYAVCGSVCVCVCVCLCVFVYVYICMYVCMYVRVYVNSARSLCRRMGSHFHGAI